MTRPKTKILVDGGDPQETRQAKGLLGFVDGQTTNPSLIAKNRHIKELIASGHKLSSREAMDEDKRIVQTFSPMVGAAGISTEVFSGENTLVQEMFSQGPEMYSWIRNAYINYPCRAQGLRAAQRSVKQGIRVIMTLCLHTAVVYAATEETREPAYVSPFVGRLDEIGQNGMDVLKNIRRMFLKGHGHVLALAVSIRSVEHPFYCFVRQDRASNRAAKILELWASKHSPMPDEQFQYNASGKPTHTRSLTPSKRGNRLIYNTNLRARVSKNSRLDYPATLSQPA